MHTTELPQATYSRISFGIKGWFGEKNSGIFFGIKPPPENSVVEYSLEYHWQRAVHGVPDPSGRPTTSVMPCVDDLKKELPIYLAAASLAPAIDLSDVAEFSQAVLKWWRSNGNSFPAWATAARIVFALSPIKLCCM